MKLMLTAFVMLLGLSSAFAQDPKTCSIPGYLLLADNELKQVAAAVKAGRLNVVVVGSGSSLLSGADGPRSAYPARLEIALSRRLPGIAVKVVSIAKSRETAEAMAQEFEQILADSKPDLVVWQTGTVDAIRGVPKDDFQDVLSEGVEKLQAGKADVILMNPQYSPRTESMIAIGPYADIMRVVSQHYGVLLFDRLSIMRHWSEDGQFDLHAASKSNNLAQRVHDCLGRAIASLIIQSAHLEIASPKPSQ
jgi:hypothetical protein